MLEDVQLGLSFLTSVAQWAGVAAPTASGLLALGGAVVGQDFRQTGRALASLGLADHTREQMHTLVEQGL
jgi:opine dehydrogenase